MSSLIQSVHGQDPSNLIEKIVRSRIFASPYWNEECHDLTIETIIDKAMDLKALGGTYGGNKKASPFLCLLLKMLQLQPEKEITVEFINNEEGEKYLCCLGLFYMRMTGSTLDVYNYLEPLYGDWRKVRVMNDVGGYDHTHIDELVDDLLREERLFNIILPRLKSRRVLEDEGILDPGVSRLEALQESSETEESESEEEVKEEKKFRRTKIKPHYVPEVDEAEYQRDQRNQKDKRRSRSRDRQKSRSRGSERRRRSRSYDRKRSRSRDRSRRSRDRRRSRSQDRRRSRSRDRRRSRSRHRHRRRSRSRDRRRSRSRDRHRRRSRSRDRRRSKSRDRKRSRSKEYRSKDKSNIKDTELEAGEVKKKKKSGKKRKRDGERLKFKSKKRKTEEGSEKAKESKGKDEGLSVSEMNALRISMGMKPLKE
eukprot:TRINITY_DN10701_c0_g1_i1.p1 TRINITY_DN10701_c0_g1~~TRINITY_DN10701_c0_g1_i1.p1  ORF type:complete len:431 (-),score=84.28 TRINITY_DN10701_c0_g1_i1:15-1286(-)